MVILGDSESKTDSFLSSFGCWQSGWAFQLLSALVVLSIWLRLQRKGKLAG